LSTLAAALAQAFGFRPVLRSVYLQRPLQLHHQDIDLAQGLSHRLGQQLTAHFLALDGNLVHPANADKAEGVIRLGSRWFISYTTIPLGLLMGPLASSARLLTQTSAA